MSLTLRGVHDLQEPAVALAYACLYSFSVQGSLLSAFASTDGDTS